jgi:hypothetical protein
MELNLNPRREYKWSDASWLTLDIMNFDLDKVSLDFIRATGTFPKLFVWTRLSNFRIQHFTIKDCFPFGFHCDSFRKIFLWELECFSKIIEIFLNDKLNLFWNFSENSIPVLWWLWFEVSSIPLDFLKFMFDAENVL